MNFVYKSMQGLLLGWGVKGDKKVLGRGTRNCYQRGLDSAIKKQFGEDRITVM